jgi:hypothetical protein
MLQRSVSASVAVSRLRGFGIGCRFFSSTPGQYTFAAPVLGAATLIGTGLGIYAFFLPTMRKARAERLYLEHEEREMLIKYRNAMHHELLSRDYFLQDSIFDAKRCLQIAINDFRSVLKALTPSHEPEATIRAEKILARMCQHAKDQQFIDANFTAENFRWTILAGLALSLYHMAVLKHMEGDLQAASALFEESSQLISSLGSAMELFSPPDVDTNGNLNRLKQVAEWENMRVRSKTAALGNPFLPMSARAETAFFAMRQKSMQAWAALVDQDYDVALQDMQSRRAIADSLTPGDQLTHQLIQKLQKFEWPERFLRDRSSNVQSMKEEKLTVLSELWHDDIALVDVLHDAARTRLEKAERVRLALRKQVSSRLSCVLLKLVSGDITGASSDWASWKDYQSSFAFQIFVIVDKKWWTSSVRQSVCSNLMSFVTEGASIDDSLVLSTLSKTAASQRHPAADWRWITTGVRALQRGEPVPEACPKRWRVAAAAIFDSASGNK